MTNLSTLLTTGELRRVSPGGQVAVVCVSRAWLRDRDGLTPEQDVINAMKTMLSLAETPLQTAFGRNSCSRLKGRDGLFEIRRNGVRFYGGHIGETSEAGQRLAVLAFVAAEQKAGRTAADAALLDRAEASITALRAQMSAATVVDIRTAHQARTKGKA